MHIEGRRRVSVVIVNYRTPEHAVQCVRSLAAHRGSLDLDVMLVDNASGDGSPEKMREGLADLLASGFVTVLDLPHNGGFGWGNNQAILRLLARPEPPEYILLANPDCEVEDIAITALVDELDKHPRCAAAGSQLVNPDGSLSGSAFRFHGIGTEFVRGTRLPRLHGLLGIKPVLITADEPVEADWVTGACCLMRTEALRECGLFDDGFFLYFEEVELMYRMRRAGWSMRHVPASRVMHIGGASTGLREGKVLTGPSFPPYWFRSRRRYFALTRGRSVAFFASLAWLAGNAVGSLVGLLRPSSRNLQAKADRRQLFETGLRALPNDSVAAISSANDPVDRPPAWMGFQQ
jgi:GT2 family glycosyltransferase